MSNLFSEKRQYEIRDFLKDLWLSKDWQNWNDLDLDEKVQHLLSSETNGKKQDFISEYGHFRLDIDSPLCKHLNSLKEYVKDLEGMALK